MTDSPLSAFTPAVRDWFAAALGAPTPPQTLGWPPVQRGEHTLILAPTGSGKTLAAFLWGIDQLQRELAANPEASGVRIVYVSPLKALNNDVERNLRAPLEGIRHAAHARGERVPPVRVMVRTGDTPASARAAMLKHPPHILITTPESLYLLLTGARSREMFRGARAVLVDEIHTLVGNKRGTHLALSLERLERAAGGPVQRIGLSATVRPLDEAAAFLGGDRPVTIVDAKYPKALDLEVVTPVDDFRALPAETIWPSLIPQVLAEIYKNRTTLIFANNRRLAERTADRLNAQFQAERNEEVEPGSAAALAPGGLARDRGMFAIGAEGPFRAHHGSVSKEVRHKLEEDLKAGRLPALIGTSSLELGIDIGTVDTVVQLQSPRSVAQGLQRVGRSGHLVGQTSRGRIYATHREDLIEAAAIARGMLDQDVEPTRAPQNALDVLAQQVVAMVAAEDWAVGDMLTLVQRAHPYRGLGEGPFRSVLEMLSGKYYFEASEVRQASALRPKIAWDHTRDQLTALPGTRLAAVSGAGAIPDTGAYKLYLSDGKTRLGELDEEFVFESKPGDTFLLGSNVWRVTEIQDDRVIVTDAAGATPRMPFWRGEYAARPYELGARIGRFRREVVARLATDPSGVQDWLRGEYHLDKRSAFNLVEHIGQQLEAIGAISSDTTIIAESFENDAGDPHLVIHSPYGGRVNGAWAIALRSLMADRLKVTPDMQAGDDGIIFRFPQSDRETPAALVAALGPAEARERLLRELPGSAAFGAQFRMNAARALLLTKPRGAKRVPFWMQRLKAKDLLALTGRMGDFPIVVETYRDCLRDVFDVPHLEELLGRIQTGKVQVVQIETAAPSPIAAAMLYRFTAQYLYEWDAPKAERRINALALPRAALAELLKGTSLADLLKPEAVAEVSQRARHEGAGFQPRTPEELVFLLREMGDLSDAELTARLPPAGADWRAALAADGRIALVDIAGERRWVPAELAQEYAGLRGPGQGQGPNQGIDSILRRHLRHVGPVTPAAIGARYAFDPAWLEAALADLVERGEVVRGAITAADRDEVCDSHLFEQIHRRTLTLLRKEAQATPVYAWADFLAHWQHAAAGARLAGVDGLRQVVRQLSGASLPAAVWERDVLPSRVTGYVRDLDALASEAVWAGDAHGQARVFFRGEGGLFLGPPDSAALSAPARKVMDFLASEGASYEADIRAGSGLSPAAAKAALAELATGGFVTHDTFGPFRQLAGGERTSNAAPSRPLSGLEAELSARLGSRPAGAPGRLARPPRGTMADARRRVAERVFGEAATARGIADGRWSLVHRAGVLGPARDDATRAEALARLLLARHGVLARESLAREAIPWEWGQLFPLFERMEMRGEIRRGYFVAGLSGAQFALPEAVERLRAAGGGAAVTILCAADPANVYGSETLGGPRFARLPSTHVALAGGRPVAIFADSGERATTLPDAPEETLVVAVQAYVGRPNAPRRIRISSWNGAPVLGGPGAAILKAAGFDRAPGGMERG